MTAEADEVRAIQAEVLDAAHAMTNERTEALCDAAKLVALHLLSVRAGADVQRRVRADLLGAALEGGPGARAALERLGLSGQRLMVLGVAMSGAHEASAATGAADAHDPGRPSDRAGSYARRNHSPHFPA